MLEDIFLILYKNGDIKDGCCPIEVVHKIFLKQSKERNVRRYSFQTFLNDMVKLNYVKKIHGGKNVNFNQQLINKLKEQEDLDIANALNELSISSKWSQIVNQSCCNLCLVRFNSKENFFEKHEEKYSHQLRVEYAKKKYLPNLKDFVFTMTDSKNNKLKKIREEASTKFTIKGLLTNVSNVSCKVSGIIKIHPRVIDIKLKIGKLKLLNPGESLSIDLIGQFSNSAKFIFPFAIVYWKLDAEKDEFVKQTSIVEVPVIITSEWSYLDINVRYKPKEKKKLEPKVEAGIIAGEKPEEFKTNFVEKFRLLKHNIPKHLENALVDHIKENPDFIKKQATLGLNCLDSAQSLNLPTKLNEKNYIFLLRNLLHIEEFQMKVDIRDYDTQSSLTHVRNNIYELEVPGLAEARPSLVRHDSVYVKQNENDAFKYQGIVHQTREKSVILGFNRKFSEIFIKNKQFHIEFGFNRRPLKVEKQALEIAAKDQIVPYFYPKNEVPTQKYNKINKFFNTKLNDQQKAAIQNLVEIKEAPYLIFGPPGTGKTVTVVEAVLQIVKSQPEAKVLVCAPSNAAVNEIAIRLLGKVPTKDILRLLGPMYCSDKSLPQIKEICNLSPDGSFYMPSLEKILGYRVVLMTLVTAARLVNGGVPYGHYSYVFIDESGYATETESLVPVAGILSDRSKEENKGKIFGQLVLAGDPRQLGPIIHSNFVKFCGFGTSMLERLIDTCAIYSRNVENNVPYNPRYVTKLISNYRSHRAILEVPNELFYHGELVPEGNELTNLFLNWEHLKVKNFPVIFHNVLGDDRREKNSPSFYNMQEIEEIIKYLTKLVGQRVSGMEIKQEHIGVITPYRKQAEKVNQACQKRRWDKIMVGSVEQFQGREKLVIIVSTVRSQNVDKFENIDRKFQLGFVRNAKRFNVALTRAKGLLIVIGNADVLKIDENWRHFIKYCVDNKSVAGKQFTLVDEDNFSSDDDNFSSDDDDRNNFDGNPDGADFSRGNL